MNVALWVTQSLLALVFAYSGGYKISLPKEALIKAGQTGVAPFPEPVIKVTAGAELLAVLGLILPRATGIAPVLTPIAACGLMLVMAGALISHYGLLRADLAAGRGRREAGNLAINVFVLALCVFVAVGRF